MKEYAEWLCGENVWGYVVRGPGRLPRSCPHIGLVRAYDKAIRTLQARQMKVGVDFQTALERAMEDADTRTLNFTTPFSMEAQSSLCTALSAPGLAEIFGRLAKAPPQPVTKRPLAIPDGFAGATGIEKSPSAKKKARKAENKKQKVAAEKAAAAAAAKATANANRAFTGPPPALAILDGQRPPRQDRAGKGAGKGGKAPLPKGIRAKCDNGKLVCYSYNRREPRCVQEPCTFEHVCWWCHGTHPGGEKPGNQCNLGGG
jgi:hypothetical protein